VAFGSHWQAHRCSRAPTRACPLACLPTCAPRPSSSSSALFSIASFCPSRSNLKSVPTTYYLPGNPGSELLVFHCAVCCVVVNVCVCAAKDICLSDLLLLLAPHVLQNLLAIKKREGRKERDEALFLPGPETLNVCTLITNYTSAANVSLNGFGPVLLWYTYSLLRLYDAHLNTCWWLAT